MENKNEVINFFGPNACFSLFASGPVIFNRITFPTIQHALTAAKSFSLTEQIKISQLPTPGSALRYQPQHPKKKWKKAGYIFKILKDLVDQRFDPEKNPVLVEKFLATDPAKLENLNLYGDDFFGIVRCNKRNTGLNYYGIALMRKRRLLQSSMN